MTDTRRRNVQRFAP